MIHKMKLNLKPYEKIVQGKKTIELRLNDDKRQEIKIGDTIVFINPDTKKQVVVKVLSLYKAESFQALFETINCEKAGFDAGEDARGMVEQMRRYYTEKQEEIHGVVAIEFEKPTIETLFPIYAENKEIDSISILPVYDEKIIFLKDKSGMYFVPNGKVLQGETTNAAAKRLLDEELCLSGEEILYTVTAYNIKELSGEKASEYGRVFVALFNKMPKAKKNEAELKELKPTSNWVPVFPELPEKIEQSELYTLLYHTLARMMQNYELGDFSNDDDLEYYDFTRRLQCYDDDIYFDYEHFDADEFAFYIMMRNDSGDIYEKMERVPPTEENYKSIREELFVVNSIEYVDWIIEHFGIERIKEDEKLFNQLKSSYGDLFFCDEEYEDDDD